MHEMFFLIFDSLGTQLYFVSLSSSIFFFSAFSAADFLVFSLFLSLSLDFLLAFLSKLSEVKEEEEEEKEQQDTVSCNEHFHLQLFLNSIQFNGIQINNSAVCSFESNYVNHSPKYIFYIAYKTNFSLSRSFFVCTTFYIAGRASERVCNVYIAYMSFSELVR